MIILSHLTVSTPKVMELRPKQEMGFKPSPVVARDQKAQLSRRPLSPLSSQSIESQSVAIRFAAENDKYESGFESQSEVGRQYDETSESIEQHSKNYDSQTQSSSYTESNGEGFRISQYSNLQQEMQLPQPDVEYSEISSISISSLS